MTTSERLLKVYNLITAAQSLLHKGRPMESSDLIQTARSVAAQSDEYLELNKAQIDRDCEMALAMIQQSKGD